MNNIDIVLNFLEKNRDYILLRNADINEHIKNGGDIDILTNNYNLFVTNFIKKIDLPVMYIKRSYLQSFFWKWGHIDVFTSIEFRGANFLSNEEIISAQIVNQNQVSEAPLHIQALVCWLSNLLLGGVFKSRYKYIIVQAAQESGKKFFASLEYALGRSWAQRLFSLACAGRPEDSEKWIRQIRRALWWTAFKRNPFGTVIRWANYWKHQILRSTNPPAPWIGIFGMDGSGKSSVANYMKDKLCPGKPFMKICIEHWRPEFFHKSKSADQVIEPHGNSKRGTILSLAKLGFLVLDWFFGFWQSVLLPRAKGQLVIFDRHYVDLLVDPRRYRYGAPLWIARLVGVLIPKPDLFILLDLPAQVARSRKPEVPLEEARRLRKRYLDLAQGLPNARVVDADRPLNEVVADVEEIILAELQKRTTARMCKAGLL